MDQPPSKPRTVEAPAAERLDAYDAAAWCGIARKDWADLARFGLIPAGAMLSREKQWWRWEVVVAVNALLEYLLARLARRRRREARESRRRRREAREAARKRREARARKGPDPS